MEEVLERIAGFIAFGVVTTISLVLLLAISVTAVVLNPLFWIIYFVYK